MITLSLHPMAPFKNISHYSHQSKTKVIPGWDIEMDIARDKSKFWHSIWRECGREHTGIVYDIMKKLGRSIIICYEH